MVEEGDRTFDAPEAETEAALGRDGPHDPKPDLALAYHWTTYARRRNGIIPEGLKCQNQPGAVDLDAAARWRRYEMARAVERIQAVRDFTARMLAAR